MMPNKQQQEDFILEELNKQPDIHGLLKTAIRLIDKSIHQLILKAFRKERHAIKFVIPSLIGHHGPLNDLSVCLKLLYALGIITHDEYEDVELLLALVDELDNDDKIYTFIDDEILGPISLLHDMTLPPNLSSQDPFNQERGIVNTMKNSMYQQRYQQMVRSSLIIAITSLILRVSEKQEFNYFPE